MKTRSSAWMTSLITGFLMLFAPTAHGDGQEFCNETSFILYTAIAFPDQNSLVCEGWSRLRPGQCTSVLPAPVPAGEYFVFARSSDAHRGGVRQWNGPTILCVDVANFSVSGLANCEALGLEARGFHSIEGNAPTGRRTVFIETGEYGERARMAGLQRLLRDNGFSLRKIDGQSGKRTSFAIKKYLKQAKISKRPSDPELIDLLENSARKVVRQTGLEICNQADGTIWAAYAKRHQKQWETRGWWSLAKGACVQLISDPLQKRDKYYLYAGLRNPDGEAPLLDASEVFCVDKVKFSIFGRHDCAARGYLQTRFQKVDLAKGSLTKLVFKPEDFGGPNSTNFDQP